MNYDFKFRGNFIISNLSKKSNLIDSKLNTMAICIPLYLL